MIYEVTYRIGQSGLIFTDKIKGASNEEEAGKSLLKDLQSQMLSGRILEVTAVDED